uniref:Uncharacterized protein n=1 Tax=Meloidogyne hapla TaxID=6305 RepID=A0A1I8BGB1_MELHA
MNRAISNVGHSTNIGQVENQGADHLNVSHDSNTVQNQGQTDNINEEINQDISKIKVKETPKRLHFDRRISLLNKDLEECYHTGGPSSKLRPQRKCTKNKYSKRMSSRKLKKLRSFSLFKTNFMEAKKRREMAESSKNNLSDNLEREKINKRIETKNTELNNLNSDKEINEFEFQSPPHNLKSITKGNRKKYMKLSDLTYSETNDQNEAKESTPAIIKHNEQTSETSNDSSELSQHSAPAILQHPKKPRSPRGRKNQSDETKSKEE